MGHAVLDNLEYEHEQRYIRRACVFYSIRGRLIEKGKEHQNGQNVVADVMTVGTKTSDERKRPVPLGQTPELHRHSFARLVKNDSTSKVASAAAPAPAPESATTTSPGESTAALKCSIVALEK